MVMGPSGHSAPFSKHKLGMLLSYPLEPTKVMSRTRVLSSCHCPLACDILSPFTSSSQQYCLVPLLKSHCLMLGVVLSAFLSRNAQISCSPSWIPVCWSLTLFLWWSPLLSQSRRHFSSVSSMTCWSVRAWAPRLLCNKADPWCAYNLTRCKCAWAHPPFCRRAFQPASYFRNHLYLPVPSTQPGVLSVFIVCMLSCC